MSNTSTESQDGPMVRTRSPRGVGPKYGSQNRETHERTHTVIRAITWVPVLEPFRDNPHEASRLIYIYIYTCIYACMHTCMHAYMLTCIHACIHTHIQPAYMHTCVHAYLHTCVHTYINTHIHIHIYAYMHAYIHIYTCVQRKYWLRILCSRI